MARTITQHPTPDFRLLTSNTHYSLSITRYPLLTMQADRQIDLINNFFLINTEFTSWSKVCQHSTRIDRTYQIRHINREDD